jgi:antitoxin component of MazEF toxin-antitoxin module
MFETQVFNHGNEPAILLDPESLHALGVRVGDSVQVSVANGEILVRPLNEQSRQEMLNAAVEDVMRRRESVFEELAKGAK